MKNNWLRCVVELRQFYGRGREKKGKTGTMKDASFLNEVMAWLVKEKKMVGYSKDVVSCELYNNSTGVYLCTRC